MSSVDNAEGARIMNGVVLLRRPRPETLSDEFRSLFDAAYAQVVRTVWFVVRDYAVAEEITQDAFVELYRHWRQVCDYDQPGLWVRRVALNKAQREAARTARRAELERKAAPRPLVDDGPQPPHEELWDAIRTLPPRQRAVVVLFYLEDRPMDEVADLVGCSTATGYVQLHQARHRLAELLSEEVDGDVR
jgi:RNA polymerase sigma factor (sigma-70 family)